jgi:hypothetical protein
MGSLKDQIMQYARGCSVGWFVSVSYTVAGARDAGPIRRTRRQNRSLSFRQIHSRTGFPTQLITVT